MGTNDARPSPERRRLVEGLLGSGGLGNTGMSVSDLTPVGNVLGLQEDAQHGNKLGVGVNAMALLPGIKAPIKTVEELSSVMASKYPQIAFNLRQGRAGPVVLDKVIVPQELRGQGIGSNFMNDLTSYADQEGKTLSLTPSSDFGGVKSKLVNWYKSLGFQPNTGRYADHSISESMYRLPQEQ